MKGRVKRSKGGAQAPRCLTCTKPVWDRKAPTVTVLGRTGVVCRECSVPRGGVQPTAPEIPEAVATVDEDLGTDYPFDDRDEPGGGP